jgi:hypothetical protein
VPVSDRVRDLSLLASDYKLMPDPSDFSRSVIGITLPLPTRDGLRNVVTFFRAGPPKKASRATWRRADSILRDWLRSRGLEVNAVERCSTSPRGIETHMRAALLPHVESQSESPFAFGNYHDLVR